LYSGGKWSIVVTNKSLRWIGAMFIGEYQHSIDAKSRIIVPSKFRDDLGNRFILTKGLDNCLFIFSMEEWSKFEEKLKNLPVASKEARAFVRYFFSGAIECETDKQGRLTIPQNLREYAKIEKELVAIGVLSRVEIWSRQEWERYEAGNDLGDDGIAEKMAELGI
jgi:MraZ protein